MNTENTIGLLKLLQICDSLFPVGTFTLSNGLETYVQNEIITSPNGLREYLNSYISLMPYNELGAAAIAYKADEKELIRLDEIYTAVKAPSEIRKGSQRVAKRFFSLPHDGCGKTELYKKLVANGACTGHQPIAWGAYMSDCGIKPLHGLNIYGYSVCSAIVTNCVKLVPLSQTAGQSALHDSFEKISRAAELALNVTSDEIGVCGAGFELRAMQHEKLYSRQYMS